MVQTHIYLEKLCAHTRTHTKMRIGDRRSLWCCCAARPPGSLHATLWWNAPALALAGFWKSSMCGQLDGSALASRSQHDSSGTLLHPNHTENQGDIYFSASLQASTKLRIFSLNLIWLRERLPKFVHNLSMHLGRRITLPQVKSVSWSKTESAQSEPGAECISSLQHVFEFLEIKAAGNIKSIGPSMVTSPED